MMLVLNMIVKNESKVISRCLDSVLPFIDSWIILDTGSTDGTQEIIQSRLKDLPGELHEEPFVDFATSRTQALRLCQSYRSQGHALTIDADEVLEQSPDFDPKAFCGSLDRDLYDVKVKYGPLRYTRPLIYGLGLPWRYRAVVHEFLDCPAAFSRGMANGFHLVPRPDGSRSMDHDKFLKDAKAIEKALLTEQDPMLIDRYRFYLGQCYKDAGMPEKAYAAYLERGRSGGWLQEKALALAYAGECLYQSRGSESLDRVISLLFEAHQLSGRKEPMCTAARLCRLHARFDQAYGLARMGHEAPGIQDGLFMIPQVYEWGMAEEYSLACYYSHRYAEAVQAYSGLLSAVSSPTDRQRIENGLAYSRKKLAAQEIR